MSTTKAMAVTLGAILFGALGACGGGGSSGSGTTGGAGGTAQPGCGDDPFACPAGQTCWIADAQGSKLECLNSGKAKAGEGCKNYVATPTCEDGLICFQASGDKDGVCTPFCDPKDPAHACPDKGSCFTLSFAPGDAKTHACAPPDLGTGGGGASGTGGASGSGGSGGSGGK